MMVEELLYRIEKDFIGEKKVPQDAYYGIQTLRAAENFPITGYRVNRDLIRAIAIVKKSAAQANRDIGQLDEELAKAIIQASDEVMNGALRDQFLVDPIQGGAGTSVNMNANEVIANRALEILGHDKGSYDVISPNSHVNMAQSTNDAFPTAIHIATLVKVDKLLEVMEALHKTFLKKSIEFQSVLKMGRTHLQDAVPIRLGQEFEAYAMVLRRDIERVRVSRVYLYEINMGATAVGTGLNADPLYIEKVANYLSENSGFELKSSTHLVDATQNTDSYVQVSAALRGTMLNMSKICNDLRLMASGPRTGLSEISLPARQPGSSIMLGKVNPVMAEVMNQVAFQVAGNDMTIALASEAGQFELNVMEPVLVFNLLQSLKIMTNVFEVFRDYCLDGITANVEHLEEYVEKSIGVITAINPHVGYEVASQIAKEALLSNKSIRELCIEKKVLTEEELDLILHPFEMTKPGISGKDLLKNKIVLSK